MSKSLSRQLILGFSLSLAVVGITTLWLNYRSVEDDLERQSSKRAQSIARSLEFATEGLLEFGNLSILERMVQNFATLPAVNHVSIIAPDGRVVASNQTFSSSQSYTAANSELKQIIEQAATNGVEKELRTSLQDRAVIIYILPFASRIFTDVGKRGVIAITIDLNQIQQDAWRIFVISTQTMFLGILVIVSFIVILLRNIILIPIEKLTRAISRSQQTGEIELPQNLPNNEIKFLAHTLSQAVKELRDYERLKNAELQVINSQLEDLSASLEQKVLERTQELRLANQELEAAKDAALESSRAKTAFFANMSHELRTPLNGILGYAQILTRSQSWGEKERKGVDIIYQCGSHLLTLINDVLDISKIEARKLELDPGIVHLPALLQGIVEIVNVRAKQKGIHFMYLPDANLPEGIEVDEKRLRQVLINLLGNAVKFTDRGKVIFKVKQIESEGLAIESEGNSQFFTPHAQISRLRFQVEDTGIGMSAEVLEKIFQPFEQVSSSKRNSEGTGLGLAISQAIVQLMGSQIQVQSQLGVGSTFFFDVELPIAAEWQQSRTILGSDPLMGYQGARQTILIVDDKWENRSVIASLLVPLGFSVIEAEDGQSGLTKALQVKPNLIITDIQMPVMDGYQFLQQIRQSEILKTLPVIVSSASVSSIDQQQSLDAGGDDFLAKPIQADNLLQMLHQYLQLTWIYQSSVSSNERVSSDRQERSSVSAPPNSLTPFTPLALPPLADLEQLLQLAQQGRLKKLIEVAKALEQQHPQCIPLVNHLLELSKGFQVTELEAFIQQLLDEVSRAGSS